MRTGALQRGRGRRRGGFTLMELLVVVLIVLIVSAAALPVVLPALNHRQLSEGARLLQGAIVGAQDAAVHANAPRGIRLMPDPTYPQSRLATGVLDPTKILASNRIVPLEAAPDYAEGRLTPYPSLANLANPPLGFPLALPYPGEGGGLYPFDAAGNATAPVLVVEEALYDTRTVFGTMSPPNNPTSWFWNIRVGDKIRIGESGWLYTVVGPMVLGPADGNTELFVNVGTPGAPSPLQQGMEVVARASGINVLPNKNWGAREFLFLVNGRDDNNNGLIDEGWDGIDNDNDGLVDDLGLVDGVNEWETERWVGGVAGAIETNGFPMSLSYTIVRRPAPSSGVRETALPAGVVIDLTTWGYRNSERSRLPVDRFTGYVDIMFSPRGEVVPTTIYSTPASSPMSDAFYHFWLAERQDLRDPAPVATPPGYTPPYLPITQGLIPGATDALKGDQRIVTLFTRTGRVATDSSATFLDPVSSAYGGPNRPFISARQGGRGGQ